MNEVQTDLRSEEQKVDSSSENDHVTIRHKLVISRKLKRRLSSGIVVTDISSGLFRYVYLVKKKGKIVVKDFGELDREHFGIESDDPLDLYRAGLVWVEGNSRIKARDVLVVSSHLDFFIRKLDLPLSKKGEIERAARWETGKQIPIEVEDSYLKIRRNAIQDGICKLTVGAVPRNQINYWQFLDKRLIGIVPTPVALVPAGPSAISEDLTYCYVYYIDSLLYIGFYSSFGLLYHHPIIEEPSTGLFEKGDPFFSRSRIVDELANGLEVFYNRFPDKRVAGIVLFMSSEEIGQLAPLIGESIVIDVIPASFPENVEIDESCEDKKLTPGYFPLLGAARVENKDFIFLPKILEDNVKIRIIRKTIYYSFSAGFLTLLLFSLFLIASVNIKKVKLANIINQKAQIENSTAFKKSHEYLERANSMTTLKNQFDQTDDRYSDLYRSFSNLTPGNIYLNNILLDSESGEIGIEISGYFEGNISKADVTILDFMDNLKGRGLEQIKLERLGQKISGNRKTESFTITGKYR